jgi:hypothetical protein
MPTCDGVHDVNFHTPTRSVEVSNPCRALDIAGHRRPFAVTGADRQGHDLAADRDLRYVQTRKCLRSHRRVGQRRGRTRWRLMRAL